VSDLSKTSQNILTARDLTLPDGTVNIDLLVRSVHLSRTELAGVLGISRDAISKSSRLRSNASQRRLRDLVEILVRVSPWAGSVPQAFAWFTSQPLPSFGQQTADLFREGCADAVKAYVSRIAVGGYA
jgi:hypothetical protein